MEVEVVVVEEMEVVVEEVVIMMEVVGGGWLWQRQWVVGGGGSGPWDFCFTYFGGTKKVFFVPSFLASVSVSCRAKRETVSFCPVRSKPMYRRSWKAQGLVDFFFCPDSFWSILVDAHSIVDLIHRYVDPMLQYSLLIHNHIFNTENLSKL